ncbi:MAG: hypothetical protein UY41_C0046G0008 [Candidatus Moranbacteria bacterium GW2011_GWE1_49_15]|nr:MAG: hypothetical protein UX75_C0012G0007 [Candidatus Moranbacteria bacterium GW2011_GWE2_47_10]KKW05601.1 MAG: hypothetical protein UY41_C0046G0008 [Candidatus Moranbacteria bacterium GW2011_GWE1_49_15]HBP01304.1 hypothetical protein [Candidatus Moranbacteria bacterium]
MSTHFVAGAKKLIVNEKLQDLSGDGWGRMRQLEREVNDGRITLEDAIEKFLNERDYRHNLKKYKTKDLLKIFK